MQTRQYPRTLQQAFGPYTSNRIDAPREFRWSPIRIALALTYAAAIILLAIVLPGGPV